MHIHIPVELIEKIDRLRKGAETRKDIIIRAIREMEE
jgi:metal-responsive CopG/Arc/MetJ family transcriptional regulator